jgi:hypothetical protein
MREAGSMLELELEETPETALSESGASETARGETVEGSEVSAVELSSSLLECSSAKPLEKGKGLVAVESVAVPMAMVASPRGLVDVAGKSGDTAQSTGMTSRAKEDETIDASLVAAAMHSREEK